MYLYIDIKRLKWTSQSKENWIKGTKYAHAKLYDSIIMQKVHKMIEKQTYRQTERKSVRDRHPASVSNCIMYESWASWFCWYTANGINSCIVMGATYTYLYSTAIPNCECKCDQSYVLYNLNCYQFSLLSLSQSCSHFALQCNSMWLHHVSVCCVLQICIFQSKIWRFISKMCLVGCFFSRPFRFCICIL